MNTLDEQRRWKQILRLSIWSAVLVPMAGVAAMCWAMIREFHSLQGGATGDPAKLSKAIGEVLVFTAIGLPVGFIGLVVAIVAWIKVSRLRRNQEVFPSNDAAP